MDREKFEKTFDLHGIRDCVGHGLYDEAEAAAMREACALMEEATQPIPLSMLQDLVSFGLYDRLVSLAADAGILKEFNHVIEQSPSGQDFVVWSKRFRPGPLSS